MVSTPRLLGLSGAPSTGKSTLARALAQALRGQGVECALLLEPARELAARGVRIDDAMQVEDYDAFLDAYLRRDAGCAGLGVADRTPADHYSYLRANQPLPQEFMQRHHDAALAALQRYRAVLYLPLELPLVDDHFRILRADYRAMLDHAIVEILGEAEVPVITLRGGRGARLEAALAAIRRYWPELSPPG